MYERENKFISTPIDSERSTSSLSLSDIKCSSADNIAQVNKIYTKKINNNDNIDKKIKRKKKIRGKIPKRKKIISVRYDSEEEIQDVKGANLNNDNSLELLLNEDTIKENEEKVSCKLLQSPERIRDVCLDHDYVLYSPSLISKRQPFVFEDLINEENDQENNISLDLNTEITHISPIFKRKNQVNVYPSAKRKRLKERLLENKNSGNWLVDVRVPTDSADLLWDKYVMDHYDELPERVRSKKICEANIEKFNTDNIHSDDTWNIIEQGLKSKKLCSIKGTLKIKPGTSTIIKDNIRNVSSDDTENSKSPKKKNEETPKTSKKIYRKKNSVRKKEIYDYSSSNNSNYDKEVKSIKLMSFNEFNMKEKVKKSNYKKSRLNSNKYSCLPSSSVSLIEHSKAKINAITRLVSKRYRKHSDGNYIVTNI